MDDHVDQAWAMIKSACDALPEGAAFDDRIKAAGYAVRLVEANSPKVVIHRHENRHIEEMGSSCLTPSPSSLARTGDDGDGGGLERSHLPTPESARAGDGRGVQPRAAPAGRL